MNVKNTVKTIAYRIHHALDPGLTDKQVSGLAIASVILLNYYTMFIIGFVLGAAENLSPTGLPKAFTIAQIWSVESELWVTFADANIIAKSVFGVIYPVIAIGIWITEIGVTIGYILPEYVIRLGLPVIEYGFPAIFVAIAGISLFYFSNMVYRTGIGIGAFVRRYAR